jgi:hypothetical protein
MCKTNIKVQTKSRNGFRNIISIEVNRTVIKIFNWKTHDPEEVYSEGVNI